MCGIIGYIGSKNPKDILVEGLKNLEYRGYDSAGIALKGTKDIQIIKSVGRIKNLEEEIKKESLIDSVMGIAHTRWATHGCVNTTNAHPHQVGRITLVHNGIIENAKELKDELIKEGIKFKSETDTEVVAALLDILYEDDIVAAINKMIKMLKGSYALGILVEGKDELYALRKDSPLIIGIGDNEHFIASDIAAIINYTNKYMLLEEGEVAVLDKDKVKVTLNGKEIKKEIKVTDLQKEQQDKNGYEHYMLKEIMEEPLVLQKTLQPFLNNLSLLPDLSKYDDIHVVACGSAMYAGMIGKTLFEEYAGVKVDCEVASEYRYKKVFYKKTLVIVISQSGETADTIAAMRKAKENKVDTLAIVNVKTSTIAREADKHIFIEAGPEIAVATTKAYLLQVAIMALLAYKMAYDKKLIDNQGILEEAKLMPSKLEEILSNHEIYKEIARKICKKEDAFFIGRKIDYAMALEGSLKLKEVAYIHSEAYQAGELKHGTISLINEGMPVFALITDDEIKDKTLSNVIEVKSRGAQVIIVTNDEKLESDEFKLVVPKVSPFFQAIYVIPTLQLISYYVAKLRDCDIDKPKNLAKSVTVE